MDNMNVQKSKEAFQPGEEVFVVERDEVNVPDCVSGYAFITSVCNVALVHPYINGSSEIDCILHECIERSKNMMECDISAFPIDDCYCSYEEAEKAMEAEMEE